MIYFAPKIRSLWEKKEKPGGEAGKRKQKNKWEKSTHDDDRKKIQQQRKKKKTEREQDTPYDDYTPHTKNNERENRRRGEDHPPISMVNRWRS